MVKQVFRVTDMHCSNCVMRIEGLEDDLPLPIAGNDPLDSGQMTVEYDETRLSEAQILAEVARLGYTATA